MDEAKIEGYVAVDDNSICDVCGSRNNLIMVQSHHKIKGLNVMGIGILCKSCLKDCGVNIHD